MKISIIAGPQLAPPEQTAVDDLGAYLKGLFDIDAAVRHEPDASADAFFVVGNPQSNPHTAAAWSSVSEQGTVLRRC
jgi:hypothetical protein